MAISICPATPTLRATSLESPRPPRSPLIPRPPLADAVHDVAQPRDLGPGARPRVRRLPCSPPRSPAFSAPLSHAQPFLTRNFHAQPFLIRNLYLIRRPSLMRKTSLVRSLSRMRSRMSRQAERGRRGRRSAGMGLARLARGARRPLLLAPPRPPRRSQPQGPDTTRTIRLGRSTRTIRLGRSDSDDPIQIGGSGPLFPADDPSRRSESPIRVADPSPPVAPHA